MSTPPLSRRDWLKLSAAGAFSGWFANLARSAAAHPKRKGSCILLWMPGGPSQMDTFDLEPGHKNGGPLKEIATAVPGIKISELLPGVAQQMKHLALIRSMSTKEGDHGRATYLLRTGNLPQEPLQYPTLGALFAKELGNLEAELPGFVSIGTARGLNDGGFSAGFLGPDYAPLLVGNSDTDPYAPVLTEKALRVPDLRSPAKISSAQRDKRIGLLDAINSDFTASHEGIAVHSLGSAYSRALRLMNGTAAKAFDLDDEKPKVRDRYGRNLFGQGCLLARRLVERKVPFIEVSLGRVPGAFAAWDTHARNFASLKALCGVLDPAWSALMSDLKDRGLLETTTIVWMGEFGRTPRINPQSGRDHYPNAWSVVLGGGGIKGGSVIGKTSADGAEVKDHPVKVPDLLTASAPAAPDRPRSTNLVVHPGQPADAWLPRMIDHYDSTSKGSLAPRDIDFDSATFAKLDRNSDGRLSREELLNWFARAPNRTLTVTLGKESACYLTARRQPRASHVPKNDPIYAKWSYCDAGLGPWGRTDYAANDQVIRGGMGNVMKPEQVIDGLSVTALAAEKAMDTRAVRAGGWYWDEPIILGGSGGTGRKGSQLLRDSSRMLEDAADNWGSPDAGGVQFLFCDGHVRLLGYDTSRKLVAAVISPRGGEDVDLP